MKEIEHFFCSDIAREFQIPLIGTATHGNLWFLLEYNGRWGKKAFEESTIPAKIQTHLKKNSDPELIPRVLLIRQENGRNKKGLSLFIAHTTPKKPQLFEFHIKSYDDILGIDISFVTSGKTNYSVNLREEPIFLVCTNGKRDQCCARYGIDHYRTMSAEFGSSVWQSSHIGGHNKAPVTLFFPHGVNYGQTTPQEMRQLMQEYQQNKIRLKKFRGRVCFAPHVQAAEYFWRQEINYLGLPGIQINCEEQVSENEWLVEVIGVDGNNARQIIIQQHESENQIPITCSKEKFRPIHSFHKIRSSAV